MTSFHLALLQEGFSCCFIWCLFFYLPILAAFCVCVYVLDRSSLTPSLCAVALWSRYSEESSSAVSLVNWAGAPEWPVWVCKPSVIIVFLLLLACLWVGLAVRLADCEAQPNHGVWVAVHMLIPQSRIHLSRVYSSLSGWIMVFIGIE